MKIHLDDCSDLWEEYINEAYESIIVFTPFFDELLVRLLVECSLPYSEITLITQLDWVDDSELNLRRLKLIIQLMNLGVNVMKLDQLHAKVLFVDRERAVFGSQNFTFYSTQSYEISTEIELDDDSYEIFEKFYEWIELSTQVTSQDLVQASGYRLKFISSTDQDDEDDEDDEDDDDDDDDQDDDDDDDQDDEV